MINLKLLFKKIVNRCKYYKVHNFDNRLFKINVKHCTIRQLLMHRNSFREAVSDYTNLTTLVIPIYNGCEFLTNLLDSIFLTTNHNVKIIAIDDFSSDERIIPLLNKYKNDLPNLSIIQNANNVGFTKTINKAMDLVKTKYAVIINTDVILPKEWLNRLIYQFDKYNKIATITPFTNAGTFMSFPAQFEDNSLICDLDEIDNAFKFIGNSYNRNLIFSGTGFCMAINMEAWKLLNGFDSETFKKGYGEENDFCFRALKKGYKHLVTPNLFVYHKHGGSFAKETKNELNELHQKKLIEKYPHYMFDIVPSFAASNKFLIYRQMALLNLISKSSIALIFSNNMQPDLNKNESSLSLIANCSSNNHWIIHFDKKLDPKDSNKITAASFKEIRYLFKYLKIKNVIIDSNYQIGSKEKKILSTLKKRYLFNINF